MFLLTVISGWALLVNGNAHGPGVKVDGNAPVSYTSDVKIEEQSVHELGLFFDSHELHVEWHKATASQLSPFS